MSTKQDGTQHINLATIKGQTIIGSVTVACPSIFLVLSGLAGLRNPHRPQFYGQNLSTLVNVNP